MGSMTMAFLAITPEPGNATVVATGVLLVFMILVLLCLIITVQGKIFDGIAARKKAGDAAKNVAPAKTAAAPVPAPAAPAPVVEDGISEEVVAAIAAAIACMDGGKYTLRSVSRASHSRGAWGRAGVNANTQPF